MKNINKTALACAAALFLAACGSDNVPEATQLASSKSSAKESARVVAYAQGDYFATVQKIYLAYFGRPADYSGLRFFADQLAANNAPTDIAALQVAANTNANLRAILDVFSNSKESLDLYAGDNATFIESVYTYLFSRPSDPAGKAFWVKALNDGVMTRATAAINIMISAQGSDITIIERKAAVAANFTTALDLPSEQRAYSGLTANASVRSMLSQVNASTDVNAFQSTIDSTISQLVANAPASPEGLYRSALLGSGNTHIDILMVDGDVLYGAYGAALPSMLNMTSFVQGSGTSNGVSFSSSDAKDFGPTVAESVTINANYNPGTTLTGTIKIGTGTININGTAVATSTYNYNTPANLADVAGTWRMTRKNKQNADVVIAANGTLTGTTTNGCNMSGTLKPRASGKNVFDVSLTYGSGTSCEIPSGTVTGVAYSTLYNSGATRQLIISATNAARTSGVNYYGYTATAAGQVAALQVLDTTLGTGATAAAGDTLQVHYSGYVYSANIAGNKGAKFDSSVDRGTPIQFKLGAGSVIQGWEQGLVGLKQGGKRTLIIPASLGYGATGSGTTIPPNATLVFDVELIAVAKGS